MRGACVLGPLVLLGAVALSVVTPSHAAAHGGRPQTYDVLFSPDDADTLLVPASFGTLLSEDGGASFSMICLESMPDPRAGTIRPFAFTPGGAVLIAQEFGLVRAARPGCGFAYAEASLALDLRDAFIADVVPFGDDVLVLRSDAAVQNQVFVARADGTVIDAIPARFDIDFLPERLRVAPSDASWWWVSGTAHRAGSTLLEGRVYLSRDGGESYTAFVVPLAADERRLRVLAIDPVDPRRAIAVVHALRHDELLELTLTDEGLTHVRRASFEADALRVDRAFAAAFVPDGSCWVGNDLAGLHALGPDGTLTVIDKHLALACAVVHGEDIYLCADDFPDDTGDGFAVGRQRLGAPYAPVPVLTYRGIVGPYVCDDATDATCAARWPETLVDLGREPGADAGVPLDAAVVRDARTEVADAGTRAPVGGCSCHIAARGPSRRSSSDAVRAPARNAAVGPAWSTLVFAALLSRALMRRRRCPVGKGSPRPTPAG